MNNDVLIIGGGVIGLSIARELHMKGVRKITLVERGEVGKEASWAAAGMLSPDVEADELDDFHRFCTESREIYPDLAVELLDETGIDIEVDRSGTLYLAFSEQESDKLYERFTHQREAGIAVEHWSNGDILKAEPNVSPAVRASLFFPNDWQVENRKLLAALRKYAELNGIEINEHTAVSELMIEGGRVAGARAETERFAADKTILATGAWTSLIKFGESPAPLNIKPIRGQMIYFQTGERIFNKVIYSHRGYVVPRADGRILVGSTSEDCGFENRVTQNAIDELKAAANEISPYFSDLAVAGSWSGLRPCSPDELPIIGEVSGFADLVVATGHYRNGILLAPLTARIVAEKLIDGVSSDYFDLFGLDRFAANSVVARG